MVNDELSITCLCRLYLMCHINQEFIRRSRSGSNRVSDGSRKSVRFRLIYSNRAVSHSIHSSVASYEVGNKDSYVLHLSLMVCSVSGEKPFLQCVC